MARSSDVINESPKGNTRMTFISGNSLRAGWFASGLVCLVLSIAVAFNAGARDQDKSTEQIKQAIIKESVASYPGTCACPYNAARNGTSCGRRSAYSRPGGYAPLCYPSDVTDEMVEKYRRQHSR